MPRRKKEQPTPQPAQLIVQNCHFETKGPDAGVVAAVQALAEMGKECAKALQSSHAPMLQIGKAKE